VVNDTDPSARCHGAIARAVDYQVRIRRRFTALPTHLGSDPEWKPWWNAVAMSEGRLGRALRGSSNRANGSNVRKPRTGENARGPVPPTLRTSPQQAVLKFGDPTHEPCPRRSDARGRARYAGCRR
jgi:hypothetical protein